MCVCVGIANDLYFSNNHSFITVALLTSLRRHFCPVVEKRSWNQAAWVENPAFPFPCQVVLGKFWNLSALQFFELYAQNENNTTCTALSLGLHKLMHIKYFIEVPGMSPCSINRFC